MKNLLLLVTDFLMTRSTSVRWVADYFIERVRKIAITIILSFIALIFLNAAVQMIVMDIQRSSERQQALTFTSVSIVGVSFVVLSLLAIYLFLRKSMWETTGKTTELVPGIPPSSLTSNSSQTMKVSPITQAISALVMDFIEERREGRSRKTDPRSQIQDS